MTIDIEAAPVVIADDPLLDDMRRLLAEHLEHHRRVVEQRNRDWDALMVLIAQAVGTEDDREAADLGEVDEFDPWHALRTHSTDLATLRPTLAEVTRERDAAREEARCNGAVMSKVNAALNRAGCYSALYFWEHIDAIAFARDAAIARAEAAEADRSVLGVQLDGAHNRTKEAVRRWQDEHARAEATEKECAELLIDLQCVTRRANPPSTESEESE